MSAPDPGCLAKPAPKEPVPAERTIAELPAGLDPHTLAAAGAAHPETIAAQAGPSPARTMGTPPTTCPNASTAGAAFP